MKRILCIDDDQDILESIDLILTSEGYEVETSTTPKNIFSLIHRFDPHLLILDIRMEEFNGLDICKAVKSYFTTQEIPILMVSSDASIQMAKSQYDANDILLKPFNIDSLVSKVEEVLVGASGVGNEEAVEAG